MNNDATHVPSDSQKASILLTFGLSLGLFFILSGAFSFWQTQSIQTFGSSKWGLVVASVFLLLGVLSARFSNQKLSVNESGIVYTLLVLFLSDWLTRGYNLLQGPEIRGEILLMSFVGFFLLRFNPRTIFLSLLSLSVLGLVVNFFAESNGKVIFSDDHSVFFYRLDLVINSFPRIPVYDPLWSMGRDSLHLFATGVLNMFFITAPLLYFFDLDVVYNWCVLIIAFGVVPLSMYASARVLQIVRPGPEIAAILSFTSSLVWYRWVLKYGAMGFVTSVALLPLVLSMTSWILNKDFEIKRKFSIAFVVIASLMLFWSASGLACIPAIILGVFQAKRLLSNKAVLGIVFSLLLIHLPWIIGLWSGWNVNQFLGVKKKTQSEIVDASTSKEKSSTVAKAPERGFPVKKHELSPSNVVRKIRETAITAQPLILLFGPLGIFALAHGRRLWAVTALWLLVLGSVGPFIKPQLELERMLMVLVILLSVPAGELISRVILRASLESASRMERVKAAFIFGFLVAGVFSVASVLSNRTREHYYFSTDVVKNLAAAIDKNTGEGRALFTGFVLHELEHGHLAALSHYTNKPMVASTHTHELWRYKQVIPSGLYNQGEPGIQTFFNMTNATLMIAHERGWNAYFSSRPEEYTPLERIGRFTLYRRNNFQPSYFVEGSGEVLKQTNHYAEIRLHQADAIIKFKHDRYLEVPGCEVEPYEIDPELRLVKLSNCPVNQVIRLSGKPLYRRFFSKS